MNFDTTMSYYYPTTTASYAPAMAPAYTAAYAPAMTAYTTTETVGPTTVTPGVMYQDVMSYQPVAVPGEAGYSHMTGLPAYGGAHSNLGPAMTYDKRGYKRTFGYSAKRDAMYGGYAGYSPYNPYYANRQVTYI